MRICSFTAFLMISATAVHFLTFICALDRMSFVTGKLDFREMNISALLAPPLLWFRRHTLVHCLLGAFPKSHDQWIEFNNRAKAYVDLGDHGVRNVFLKRSFEPDLIKLVSVELPVSVVSCQLPAGKDSPRRRLSAGDSGGRVSVSTMRRIWRSRAAVVTQLTRRYAPPCQASRRCPCATTSPRRKLSVSVARAEREPCKAAAKE
jgi:hypothetical protein